MKFRTLIRRSLRFHWRSHLGVVLGAAVGSAALIGALVVGDSVRGSLRERALERLAGTWAAMNTTDRFFTLDLLDRMRAITSNQLQAVMRSVATTNLVWARSWPNQSGHGLLQFSASVSRQDEAGRANRVSLFGVDPQFLKAGFPAQDFPQPKPRSVWVNSALARQLGLQVHDEIVVRVPKPTGLVREAAIAPRADQNIALRLEVSGILPPFPGNLDLAAGSRATLNAFMLREELEKEVGLDGRINLLLAKPALRWRTATRWDEFNIQTQMWRSSRGTSPFLDFEWFSRSGGFIGELSTPAETVATASEVLANAWSLADAECGLKSISPASDGVELRTPRVFIEPPIVRAALVADTNANPILTYLATLLRAGTNSTPYSMVTAAGPPWTPADLRDDEIIVSQWLADDLHVRQGDEIAMSYFLPESGAKLEEATNTFRVHSIVPLEMPWADRTLMPDFPGIEKAESTRDWDAGFPLTYEIRKKDDDYWKQHRGTPKAFITLAAGQKMWGNRFGNLTAIRFPILNVPPRVPPADQTRESDGSAGGTRGSTLETRPANADEYLAALEKKILANLKPEELGLRFEPVREQALKAAEESQDFGGLFLGFSFFLIAAALLLMAMLFQFGLEQRAPEIGTLLALGFTPKQVRKLLVREGVALAFIGGVAGAIGGIYFAKAMLHGLTTVWRDAVGATALNFHMTGQTLVIGLFASVVVSALTLWLALRKFVKREPRELLAGETGEAQSNVRSPKSKVLGAASLATGVALAGWAVMTGNSANAGAFFGAGALVLVAGLGFVSAWLARRTGVAPVSNSKATHENGNRRDACPTLGSLALRGCARRRKRSLGTVAMLACGSFLIVSIGVFRLDANRDAMQKTSGTGGFALMGETTMPVVHDLNSQSGRDFFALSKQDMENVNVVSFRVREGDEASCLNLNAARKPRLLGVKPEMLEGRFAFAKGDRWSTLRFGVGQASRLSPSEPTDKKVETGATPVLRDEIPAIGDANSIQWAMKKKVGDTIDYVDERGQPFRVRIVGAVANSILQGQLIIDEAELVKRFPGQSGYRMFLIDAPTNRVTEVSATLSRAMQDVGLELTPTATRLAQFNAVQNTYLGTFQVLGGLGLLLGSVGLGIVVLRNVLERRGELAVLMAVGFRKPQVQRLLLIENGALLALGLGLGVIAAAVAVLPAALSPGAQLPTGSLTMTLLAILLNGIAWTWLATRFAVRGDLLRALRNE